MMFMIGRSQCRGSLRRFTMTRPFHNIATLYQKELASVTPEELQMLRDKEPPVTYSQAGSLFVTKQLPLQYRTGVQPIYTGQYSKQVSTAKKVSMAFCLIGVYASKAIWDIDWFPPDISYIVLMFAIIPASLIYSLTMPYVISINRIYDKTQPQTLLNLTKDESFIFTTWNFIGKRPVNHLVKLSSLKYHKANFGWSNWESQDVNGLKRVFYVLDNRGGIKMDRIWGIVERQSGINNGRSLM